MWNEPAPDDLRKLPLLYATEGLAWPEKIIHEHFFLGACDWFMAEFCPDRRLFFGFVILHGDLVNAEWGYVSLDELRSVSLQGLEIDRDRYWTPKPAAGIRLIRAACRLPA